MSQKLTSQQPRPVRAWYLVTNTDGDLLAKQHLRLEGNVIQAFDFLPGLAKNGNRYEVQAEFDNGVIAVLKTGKWHDPMERRI